jgi:glucosamine--fructose-6-phosphate aminotransferase (isomerizing)
VCGIIGYIGRDSVIPLLVEGLKRLEYRGYDSAGVAVLDGEQIVRFRRAGKVRELEEELRPRAIAATTGIGHTRWATHGKPTEENAHPHFDCDGRIAVIHNGIMENYLPIREKLITQGHRFSSETDTEVLAHLIETQFEGDLRSAVIAAVKRVEGAFAVAVLCSDTPDCLVVARRGSPLVVASDDTGTFVSSDIPALLGRADSVQFLADDEVGELTADGFRIFDLAGHEIERTPHCVTTDPVAIQKGGYKHFMLKEIHEQARSVGETIREKTGGKGRQIRLPHVEGRVDPFDHVYFVACGTAFHASLVAEYLWEGVLPVPIQAVIASEFRVRTLHISPRTLVVAVSQSGETIDTLMAVRHAKERGAQVVALVNSEQSAIDREADASVYTRAGIEICVAATKTFTAQIAALELLGLRLALDHFDVTPAQVREELQRLALLPGRITETFNAEAQLGTVAEKIHRVHDVLYLARGVLFPVTLEGALKLKEISYIHAEGYPAGEMKHGPIALIDEGTPVVVLLSRGAAYEKVLANMEEVKARNGLVIAVTDAPDEPALDRVADFVFAVPEVDGASRPILYAVPLQLLAYYVAVQRGTDVDQPRNLAKTVTVE